MSVAAKVREAVARLHARQSYIPDHRVRRAPESEVFPSPPPWPDTGYRAALAGMADRQFCLGVKYGDQQFEADIRAAHPVIVEFSRLLVRRLRVLDVPMYAHCVWRGEADQTAAYVAGHSNARWGESPHNYGCAVDVVHSVKLWGLSRDQWSIVGHIGKEVAAQRGFKLTWGGDWRKPWDPAHWQLTDWRSLKIER